METEKIRLGTEILPNDRDFVEVSLMQSMIGTVHQRFESEIKRLDQIGDLREKNISLALEAAEKAVQAVLHASDKAIDKSEHNTAENFHKVNDFRKALDDLGKTMATRREVDEMRNTMALTTEGVRREINALTSRLDKQPEVRDLVRRADLGEGRDKGVSLSWAVIIGAIGLVGAVLAITNRLTHEPATAPSVVYVQPAPPVAVTPPPK